MNPAEVALSRHTCKAYDPSRRIPDDTLQALLTLLRHAPSSVNSQPWHFIVAGTEAGRARVARATTGPFAYNEPKILNASHVVVLCVRTDLTDALLEQLLDQEERDGRLPTAEARAAQRASRGGYVQAHRAQQDLRPWMERQVYLALGTLLLGAGALGVDATPIEGFDPQVLDRELGLAEQGLASLVLTSLGYRSEQDFNATLPKSRWPQDQVMTFL